jgi:uncharacterized membrane protein YgcG
MQTRHPLFFAPVLAAFLSTLACAGGASDPQVGLSLKLTSGVQASAGVEAAPGLVLSRIQLSVRRLRLEKAGDGDHTLAAGPLLIDVSGPGLGGNLQQLLLAQLPAGSYQKLKLDLHAATAEDAKAVPALVPLAALGASVVLTGTIDGQPFTFASKAEVELEREGAFTVGGAAPSNITLGLDPAAWFTSADGSRLDPRQEAERAELESHVSGSLEAFEDDDHDGHDDAKEQSHDDAGATTAPDGGTDGGDNHGGGSGGGGGGGGGNGGGNDGGCYYSCPDGGAPHP